MAAPLNDVVMATATANKLADKKAQASSSKAPSVIRSCLMMSREQSRRLMMADERKSPFADGGCFEGMKAHALEVPLSTYALAPWGDVVIDKNPSRLKLSEIRCGTRSLVLGVNHPQLVQFSRLVDADNGKSIGGATAVSEKPSATQNDWGVLETHLAPDPSRKAHPRALSPEIVWDLIATDPQAELSAALTLAGNASGSYVTEHVLQRWANEKQSRDETCAVGSYCYDKQSGRLEVLGFNEGTHRSPLYHSFVMESNATTSISVCDRFTQDVYGFLHCYYMDDFAHFPIMMQNHLLSGTDSKPADNMLAKCRLVLRTHVILSFSSFVVPDATRSTGAASSSADAPSGFIATQLPHLASLLLLMALFGVQHDSSPGKRTAEQLKQLVPSLQTIVGGVVLDLFADLLSIYAGAANLDHTTVHESMCQVFAKVAPRVVSKYVALDRASTESAAADFATPLSTSKSSKSSKSKKPQAKPTLAAQVLAAKQAATKVLERVCADLKSGTTMQIPCMCRRLPGGESSSIDFTLP